jgi:hypothetical protein
LVRWEEGKERSIRPAEIPLEVFNERKREEVRRRLIRECEGRRVGDEE